MSSQDKAMPPVSCDPNPEVVQPLHACGRGARVVDWARLEIVCTFTGTEGSNPSLSATVPYNMPEYIVF